jgi:hypothetical protein
MKISKVTNWVKRNIYGVVIEVGKVDRVGFKSEEDWYIDRVLYRFGKPINKRRYWNEKEFEKERSFNKRRTVVKGFKKSN